MNENLKEILLKCEVYLEEGNYDALIESLEKLVNLELKDFTKEDYEEALKIIEFLIKKAEDRKLNIAEKLMNFQRFKGYIR
ncbi:hypothetical protein [Hydrogenivirga sp. 128-5-R1-1]|uniref:hypothetical protein n=1 Tax=Hydrogenivirga sp. 128-5-R1-1 TaxID=392423 RepID=UPI00015EF7CE|nr:hypothetical protein [Hydrogenivirga sp. 128-5-R1-1]EDP74927.1 hypothetical protein HG1285_13702 [Hydrogenivirga sp. 128-5-R1-1]